MTPIGASLSYGGGPPEPRAWSSFIRSTATHWWVARLQPRTCLTGSPASMDRHVGSCAIGSIACWFRPFTRIQLVRIQSDGFDSIPSAARVLLIEEYSQESASGRHAFWPDIARGVCLSPQLLYPTTRFDQAPASRSHPELPIAGPHFS